MRWICQSCGCWYSVGAPSCPQCGADDHRDQGDPVPKIRADGTATVRDPSQPALRSELAGEEDEGGAPAPLPARPPLNAPKQEWVDWAVSTGVDRDTAGSYTKQELIDLG